MSSLFFDAGDFQRLDRERTLTEQAPRQLPEDDRSPDEFVETEQPDGLDVMLEGLLMTLQERLE